MGSPQIMWFKPFTNCHWLGSPTACLAGHGESFAHVSLKLGRSNWLSAHMTWLYFGILGLQYFFHNFRSCLGGNFGLFLPCFKFYQICKNNCLYIVYHPIRFVAYLTCHFHGNFFYVHNFIILVVNMIFFQIAFEVLSNSAEIIVYTYHLIIFWVSSTILFLFH